MRMRGELILEGLLIYQTANLVLRVLTLLAGFRWLRDATCDAARFGSFLHPTDSPRSRGFTGRTTTPAPIHLRLS